MFSVEEDSGVRIFIYGSIVSIDFTVVASFLNFPKACGDMSLAYYGDSILETCIINLRN